MTEHKKSLGRPAFEALRRAIRLCDPEPTMPGFSYAEDAGEGRGEDAARGSRRSGEKTEPRGGASRK